MQLDPRLLEILACPACHAPLRAVPAGAAGEGAVAVPGAATGDELVCTGEGCGLAYPVRDDIPVLLVDEARQP